MTVNKDLKKIIRARQQKTGESYTAARHQLLKHRAESVDPVGTDRPEVGTERLEAAVLKVNRQSARVRPLGQDEQITFRASDVYDVVPGHVVTLIVNKRWVWGGHDYASGTIERARIDIDRLGLQPLPLHDPWVEDLREVHEPFPSSDPYAPTWRRLTAKPRTSYEMDPIAWGEFPGAGIDDNPTCRAADRRDMGDLGGALDLLMEALCLDLRCVDAHAHLGNMTFDRRPERALQHYEIGMRIGELSLPSGFDGVLSWGRIYNRPFFRCMHGYGLCLWRLGRFAEAERVFERMLALNPPDNQGVRFCVQDVRARLSWEQAYADEGVLPRVGV